MSSVQLTDDVARKLRAFGKIIDVVLGKEESPKNDDDRANLVVSHGLDLMLREVLPKEEEIHQKAMVQMFDRNPEFICGYVAEAIQKGEEMEKGEELRRRWLGTR